MLVALCGFGAVAGATADWKPADIRAEALNAFAAGELDRALYYFLMLEDTAGPQGSRFEYNLGVVYYRLAAYAQARKRFLAAGEDPSAAQVAHYNVARCAEKLGDIEDASRWYARAMAGKDDRLADLARRARAAMLRRDAPFWLPGLGLSAGFDSGVVGLRDRVTSLPTEEPDLYQELSLSARHRKQPLGAMFWQGQLSAYALNFHELNRLNVQSAAAQMELSGKWRGRFDWAARVIAAGDWLDAEYLQSRSGLRADLGQKFASGYLRHALTVLWVEPARPEDVPLRGSLAELYGVWLRRLPVGIGMLRYGVSQNERESDANSPFRYLLGAGLRSPLLGDWRYRVDVDWRNSRYPGESAAPERRWRGSLRAETQPTDYTILGINLAYEHNETEEFGRDYEHLRAEIGLRYER